ncbi:ECF transporter S component [Jeotgalibaca sp. A122]|uniref:ECF transporter S component n=1 Tax=Jeotgalibaca sp. A122 TaxID=3457322 RepID=UPI003FD2DA5A
MLKGKTHRLVGISLFGALAFVLMFFAFPVLPAFSYLKIDFSDLSILVSFILYGPVGGSVSALIRSVLHYIQTGGDMGYPIGDFASFLATLSYCFPIYYFGRRAKSRNGFILALIAGTLSLTVIMTLANWVIITPLYLNILNFSVGNLRDYIVAGVAPFNIIKGVIVSVAFMIVMPKLRPWLEKQHKLMVIK